jgi:hypothetical protein
MQLPWLLTCGCSTENVVKALGLTMQDLFPGVANSAPRSSKKDTSDATVYGKAAEAVAELERQLGQRSKVWTYKDAKGDPVAVLDDAVNVLFVPETKKATGT